MGQPRGNESPRAALVDALTRAARDAALVGDVGALRIATQALTSLVGDGEGTGGAEVVDMVRRTRRS